MADNNNNRDNRNNNNKNNNRMRGILTLVLWAVVLTVAMNYISAYSGNTANKTSSHEIKYSEMVDMVEKDQVKEILFKDSTIYITPVDGYTYTEEVEEGSTAQPKSYTQSKETQLTLFTKQLSDSQLLPLLEEHNVAYTGYYKAQLSPVLTFMANYVLPIIIMVSLFMLVMRILSKSGGGFGGIGSVGKSNAKVYMEKSTGVTFKDVAGQDEAKESLTEIIDFLHNPKKYTDIGAKLPKGALLVGPPGTGKTLLAKAVAGEANVPFFSISGSDFVEMFVGMGASRVRDLFQQAAKVAPCIIFIDEIDAVGRSRDNRYGNNSEQEQTLNQLLSEIDGFEPSKGIVCLATTNRPEILDKALLRPGRFDRRIIVDNPNFQGRLDTLKVHTRKIKLAEDVDLKKIAQATAGAVGADLANLVNEAALRAVRMGRKAVNQEDLLVSFETVIAGTEKKNTVLTEMEKRLVAYHEVGHAMVAYKQKNTEPVQKITIVPHTQGALGYTLLMPEEDKTELRTRDELMAKIAVSMGGRAAEEVVMNTMTNGASQDIQEATGVARNMVAMFGMSDQFGMMALASRRSQYLDGGYGLDCAQDTAAAMDKAVKDILDKCYADAVNIIRENREDMDKVVAYLLEKETITGAEMVAIIEGRDPSTVEDAYASTLAHENGFRPSQPEVIEPAARKVHMISEKIEAPENALADGETNNEDKPSSDEAPSDEKPESKQENDSRSE